MNESEKRGKKCWRNDCANSNNIMCLWYFRFNVNTVSNFLPCNVILPRMSFIYWTCFMRVFWIFWRCVGTSQTFLAVRNKNGRRKKKRQLVERSKEDPRGSPVWSNQINLSTMAHIININKSCEMNTKRHTIYCSHFLHSPFPPWFLSKRFFLYVCVVVPIVCRHYNLARNARMQSALWEGKSYNIQAMW